MSTMSLLRIWLLGLGSLVVVLSTSADPVQIESPHKSVVLDLSFSKDRRLLALAGGDKTISIHDWPTGKLRLHLVGHAIRVWTAAFSPDSHWLASCSGEWDEPLEGGEIKIWDLKTGKEQRALPKQPCLVFAVVFSPDGKMLLSGDWNGTVKVWEVATGHLTKEFQAHPSAVRRMAYAPGQKFLVTGGFDGTIRFWDAAAFKLRKTLQGPEGGIQCLAFSPSGAYVTATNQPWKPTPKTPGKIVFWDLDHNHPPILLVSNNLPILGLDFSADGRMLVAGGGWAETGEVQLFEVASGRVRANLGKPKEWVECVKFAPDGEAVITVGGWSRTIPGEVRIWPLADFSIKYKHTLKEVSPQQQRELWAALADENAADAYRAICTMAASPRSAVALLQDLLRPAVSADPKRLARLIADLDNGEFRMRERATKDLRDLGDQPRLVLQEALAAGPSPEVRGRAQNLLRRIEFPLPSGELLRQMRAIEVLERIGTSEASLLLRKLADGAGEARLTREAKAALERLTSSAVVHKPD
jgi:WD40 repeat protein